MLSKTGVYSIVIHLPAEPLKSRSLFKVKLWGIQNKTKISRILLLYTFLPSVAKRIERINKYSTTLNYKSTYQLMNR